MVPSNTIHQKFTVAYIHSMVIFFSWTFTPPFASNELKHNMFLNVTGSEKRYIVAHIFKIELLEPRGRVSSQL